jgi:hypothetical protein
MLLTYEQTEYLRKCSYMTAASAVYCLWQGHYNLVAVPGGVFLTSQFYWGNPTSQIRRYIDITYVLSALTYQSIISRNACYILYYLIITGCGIACYPVSWYYYNREQFWPSTYWHSGTHTLAVLANFILYSGYINPAI